MSITLSPVTVTRIGVDMSVARQLIDNASTVSQYRDGGAAVWYYFTPDACQGSDTRVLSTGYQVYLSTDTYRPYTVVAATNRNPWAGYTFDVLVVTPSGERLRVQGTYAVVDGSHVDRYYSTRTAARTAATQCMSDVVTALTRITYDSVDDISAAVALSDHASTGDVYVDAFDLYVRPTLSAL